MKHNSPAFFVNNHFDNYIKWAILKEAQNKNLVGNPMEADEYNKYLSASLEDVQKLFPDIYTDIVENGKQVFSLAQMKHTFQEGFQLSGYMCRTNQMSRYVFMDEEDYKDSKYEKDWENRYNDCIDKDTVNKYNWL
jgi:hypothetical protein